MKLSVQRKVEAAGAFTKVIVDRLAAGYGLPRKVGSEVLGVSALARAAGISLRSLEDQLHRAALPSPVWLAGQVVVTYTALLACSRGQSLEWAARQAGLAPERVRRWRRSLGFRPKLSAAEVVNEAVRLLAENCIVSPAALTAVVRGVTSRGAESARALGA